jgi:hypothetical protein
MLEKDVFKKERRSMAFTMNSFAFVVGLCPRAALGSKVLGWSMPGKEPLRGPLRA